MLLWVYQSCNIQPRQLLPNKFNTITAQGKTDPNQNIGISIKKCLISAKDANLAAPKYLGRPSKEFYVLNTMRIFSLLRPNKRASEQKISIYNLSLTIERIAKV